MRLHRSLLAAASALVMTACEPTDVTGLAAIDGLPHVLSASGFRSGARWLSGLDQLGWAVALRTIPAGEMCAPVEWNGAGYLFIFTGQPETESQLRPVIPSGVIEVNPTLGEAPLGPGDFLAVFEITGADGGWLDITSGTVTISAFDPSLIRGEIDAHGNDSTGAPVTLTGFFDAPTCEQ